MGNGETLRFQKHAERVKANHQHFRSQTDFIGDDSDLANPPGDLDAATRLRLEHELGQAEATVLRCRAELGYPLSNHLTGTSSRLEKIAQVGTVLVLSVWWLLPC